MSSNIPSEKYEAVQETVELINNYEIIAAADLNKVTSAMLQDMRKQLRGRHKFKVIKNTLMRISMETAEKEGTQEFIDTVKGSNVFLFTNGNPFKIAMELNANKVKVFAKAGDIAITDIVMDAGNTGLSPGPLIGKFGIIGVRTRIEAGNIWIVQDTTVCKKGQEIIEDLADLLQRMGIRVSEMGLSIKAVYEKGDVLLGEDLILDLDSYRTQLEQAVGGAFKVAIEAAYMTPETLPSIIAKAVQQARAVAVEAEWPTNQTIELLIVKANAEARSLASEVGKKMASA
ncbi:50S ribosomal protein L10 [Thermoproteota archaeon]